HRDRARELGHPDDGPPTERRRARAVSADARVGPCAQIAEAPRRGTRVEPIPRMDESTTPTVEMSLAALSEAVGRASQDLSAVRAALDVARVDITARNTSLTREVIKDAARVIDHLRRAD